MTSVAVDVPADGRTRRRVSGRVFGCGFGLLLLAAAIGAITTWYLRKEPHGPILTVVPLEDDLVLLRRGYAERGYVHLVRWDPDMRKQQWSEPLFGIEPDPALTVTDDAVLVRAREARGHGEVHVFAHDGTFRWRGGRARREAPDGNPAFGARSLVVAGDVVFVPHASDPVEVVLLQAADGEEIARVELPAGEGARAAAPFGDGIAVASGDGMIRSVDATGALRELGSTTGGWCVLGDTLWAGTPHALVRLPPTGDAEVVAPGRATIVGCGGSEDDRILLGEGRVLRVASSGVEERGVVEGLRARGTSHRVVGRHLTTHGVVLDLDAPAAVEIDDLDLRNAEVARALNAEDFEAAHVLRVGETLVQLETRQRARVAGLRGVRGDAQVLWAWTDEVVIELDPQTLEARHADDAERVER